MSAFDFDELLDKVLREDGRAEPLAGLEKRVMTRVRLLAGQRSKKFMVWWCAAAVAPVCVIALLLWPRSLPPRKSTVVSVSVEQRHVVPERAESKVVLPGQEKSRHLRQRVTRTAMGAPVPAGSRALPKLDVFPTPGPVPEQMQPLIEIAQRTVRGLVPEAMERGREEERSVGLKMEPITIASIEIEPLYSPQETGAKKHESR